MCIQSSNMAPTAQSSSPVLIPAAAASPTGVASTPPKPVNVPYEQNGTTYYAVDQFEQSEDVPQASTTGETPFSSYQCVAPTQPPPPQGHYIYASTAGSSASSSPAPPHEQAPFQPVMMVQVPMASQYAGLPLQMVPFTGSPGSIPVQNLYVQIPSNSVPPSQTSSPYAGSPAPMTPSSWRHPSVTTNMEVVWHTEFDNRFNTFGQHKWFLVPCLTPPKDCHSFKDSAKVRFSCKCGNGWTSMKGRVMFWFLLDSGSNTGFVYFRLFGQRCSKCNDPEFVHAMWYPEEVVKVVQNIFVRVGTVYYNFQAPTISLSRRQGKPRHQHNAKLCQACSEGVCREGFIAS